MPFPPPRSLDRPTSNGGGGTAAHDQIYLKYRIPENPRTSTISTSSSTYNNNNNNNNRPTSLSSLAAPPPPASPSRPAPQAPTTTTFSATLLILVSETPSPSLPVYLSEILSRYAVTETALLATSEKALRAARMEVYTAAGRMRQDIGVSTTVVGAEGLEDAVAKAVVGRAICGVLVCQHGGVGRGRGVLELGAREVEAAWRTNVLTLHILARATVPLLRRASTISPPFFYLDSSLELSELDEVAQGALLEAIARSSQGLNVGYAKEELVPAPPPVQEDRGRDIPNGNGYQGGVYGNGGDEYEEESLPESPTKLWASWAMMNE